MSEETVVVKDRLDHLSDVLDAQLSGDDEAGNIAFHDYITMTAQKILNPVAVEVDDVKVDDIEIPNIVDPIDDVDVDVSDIDITAHLPSEDDK